MKTAKAFDCVKMKDGIQAGLLKQWHGASQEDIRRQVEHRLATGKSDLAQWWRSMESTAVKRPR
jgi:hypothetical protein